MNRFSLKYKLLVLTVIAFFVWAMAADIPFAFKAGDVISAEQMNQNFAVLNNSKQELVTGTCAAGSSIRVIAADGTVTCEVDDIGSGAGDAGVDALNGMTGAVTLQAGDNITLDDSQAGQIKISASSGGNNSNNHDHLGQTWTGTSNTSGLAVLNTATNNGSSAVLGRSDTGSGVPLDAFAAGVWGDSKSGYGVYGTSSNFGVYGKSSLVGVVGEADFTGVIGNSSRADGIGVSGASGSSGIGVQGTSNGGYGVRGYSPSGRGVFGESQTGIGVYGTSNSNDAVVGVTGSEDTAHAAIAGSSDKGYAAYFEAGLGVGQGYATCTFHAGTTNWSCSSDRNIKENFEAVKPTQVLESVTSMPVTTWNLKGSEIRQMGPTAQDFYAAFNLGDNNTSINNTDIQGVALAAIQGLYQLVQEQQQKIEELESQLTTLQGN
jgi:Chaperone of endosialidase